MPDKDLQVAGKKRVFYRVVSGDTIASVAKALGVKQSELVDLERARRRRQAAPEDGAAGVRRRRTSMPTAHNVALLDDSAARRRDARLATSTSISPRRAPAACAPSTSRKGNEKLADVAKKYGMGSHDLARINRISYNTMLEKGQKIIVYQVADPTRSERAEEQWKKTPRARRGKPTAPRTASEGGGPVTRPAQVE